jgi:hypothetical protein
VCCKIAISNKLAREICSYADEGGVESLRMKSRRKWFLHKTGITQKGKTQNGKRLRKTLSPNWNHIEWKDSEWNDSERL